jgi:predicted nucleic acid-binding protein
VADAVVNSSPLILLAGAGRPHVLRAAGDLIVPQQVLDEIGVRGDADAAVRLVRDVGYPVVAVDVPAKVAAFGLGAGESAAIAVAIADGLEVVLDDRLARRAASQLGLRVIGTLGLLVRAKRLGLIQAVAPALEAVRGAGLRVDDQVVREVLDAAGE